MAYRGKSLRALRESKQIRLQRIANETRISLTYLKDIEEERFDRFPGEFYFHSFAREYARALELDPAEVVDDLASAYRASDETASAATPASPSFRTDEGLLERIASYFRGAQEV